MKVSLLSLLALCVCNSNGFQFDSIVFSSPLQFRSTSRITSTTKMEAAKSRFLTAEQLGESNRDK